MPGGRGWYSRGYLPHIDIPGRAQFISWRLHDAVPLQVIQRWREELADEPTTKRKLELARRIEAYCDQGLGSCILRQPPAGLIVQDGLLFDHGRRYRLHAFVVMPNHVHALLTPLDGVSLEEIMRPLKSVTATRINKLLRRSGRLWEPDFFDRLARDEKHFDRIGHYIEWNPVKAKLCADPKHWMWTSANPEMRQRLEQSSELAD